MPENLAKKIEERISSLYERYALLQSVTISNDIREQLKKLYNRAREHNNRSFIVLVVGPVKSGKSTLVNLIANSYVSPTSFLECTVRPSIISRIRQDETPYIEVFRSLLDDDTKNGDQVDQVIDNLRGLIQKEEIEDVSSVTFELNKENICEHVAIKLLEANEDTTLITAIHTPGGSLLKKNVYVVDMPGLDGAHANLDNPIYKTIANRADLIIFVQSSNSAISKVSTDFLTMLKEHNSDIPVCLVHNIFDAAYWKGTEEKESTINEQKRFAIEEIRRRGFNIGDDYSYSINLGMVSDYRSSTYISHENTLQEESRRYLDIEECLHNLIISRRDSLRVKNCINRTRLIKEQLSRMVDDQLNILHNAQDEYREIETSFNQLRRNHIASSEIITFDIESAFTELKLIYNRYKDLDFSPVTEFDKKGEMKVKEREFKTTVARAKISEYIKESNAAVQNIIDKQFKALISLWDSTVVKEWHNNINEVLLRYNLNFEQIGTNMPQTSYELPSMPEYKVEDIIKSKFWPWKHHSSTEMMRYLDHYYKLFIGNNTDGLKYKGCIEETIKPSIDAALREYSKNICQEILTVYNRYIESKKSAVLKQRNIDIESINIRYNTLKELLTELSSFNIPQL